MAIMDVNDQQCDGAMASVMEVGDIGAKFRNFGAVCVEIDGHDLSAMRDAVKEPHRGRPLIILARTSPFHTMPILEERFPRLHYVRFSAPVSTFRSRPISASILSTTRIEERPDG